MSNSTHLKQSSSSHRYAKGFTLLEVVIAIVILSLSMLGLSAMTISTINGLALSRRMTTATSLAQEKMEDIKNTIYDGVFQSSYPVEDYGTIAGFNPFRREVEIRENELLDNTKTAIVSVFWKSRKVDQPHQVTIKTIITR
jgi:type IV pilus assembly protein PilV